MKLETGNDERVIRLVAEALASKRRLEILQKIDGERSHKEIAHELDIEESSITYHIRKLLDAELISEERGRGIKNRKSKVPKKKVNKIVIKL